MNWIRRAKLAWKRSLRERPTALSHPPRGITRRTVLKGAGATLVASFLTSCFGPPKEQRLSDPSNMEWLTRHSTKGGFRRLVERWPNVNEYEMGWIKEIGHAGEVVAVGNVREPAQVWFEFGHDNDGNENVFYVRSEIHTHLTTAVGSRSASIPSTQDLFTFFERFMTRDYRTDPAISRIYHYVPLTLDGKVSGYVSFRLSDKWIANQQSSPQTVSRVIKELHSLKRIVDKGNFEMKDYQAQITSILKVCQSMGLQMRVTPMPEFVIRDGYFQARA